MDPSLAEGAGLDKLSPQQKEELMKTVQTQVALANMQELLTVIILQQKTLFKYQLKLKHYITEYL